MINIENLNFKYPGSVKNALYDIQLSIKKGALLGLIGPNAAGKTTLISLLTGVLKHTEGKITIAGYDLPKESKEVKQLIGYIPQDYAFYPNLTALENLQFFAGVQNLTSNKKLARIDYCLEFCQLKNVAKQRAAEFSGGLKRRLNIAIGLLIDPEILFFDEPTVGIDPQSRVFILQQIKALQEQGKTIIYTSHYMEEVEQLCDYLAIIDHGRVLKQGTLESLQEAQQQQFIIACEDEIDDEHFFQLKNKFDLAKQDKKLIFHDMVDLAACNQVISAILPMNLQVTSMFYGKYNLEQLFLDLTNERLRD